MATCCWLDSSAASGSRREAGEWYASFSTIQPFLQEQLQYTDNILVCTGPQASSLHEDLYDSGYRGITAIHSSSEVVQEMRQKQVASNRTTLQCQVADMPEGLAFEHNPYNAIIDKGALDAVLCRESGLQEAEAAILHVHNNMKAPGTFILFTHGPPGLRLPLLTSKVQWSHVTVQALVPTDAETALAANRQKPRECLELVDAAAVAQYGDSGCTYVYTCKKSYV